MKTIVNTSHHLAMNRRFFLMLKTLIIVTLLQVNAFAQQQNWVIRVAKLQIDSAQLDIYKAALKEEIKSAVRVEKGVLTLYAVSDKNNPTHITVFEIYANQKAYLAHLETPHFKKYKSTTKDMVKSLELSETVPIALETKRKN